MYFAATGLSCVGSMIACLASARFGWKKEGGPGEPQGVSFGMGSPFASIAFSFNPLRKHATPGSGPLGSNPLAPECEKSPPISEGVGTVPRPVDCCCDNL